MAQAKVTIESLTQMAEILRQSADDILGTKEQMDNELYNIPWDDPIGLTFISKYEEDFKPLKEKLIPNINNYIQYMKDEGLVVSEYSGESIGGLGVIGVGAAKVGNGLDFAQLGKGEGKGYIPNAPLEVASEKCLSLKKGAKQYYDQWAYEDGGKLRKYDILVRGADGKESKRVLTARNYKSFSKKTLLETLKIGLGFNYEFEDLGSITRDKNGEIIGHFGRYERNTGVIKINENILSSNLVGHDDIIETVFHENQHRNQQIRINQGCLHNVPEYIPLCKVNSESGKKCTNNYHEYMNQWWEREAFEEGKRGRNMAIKGYKKQ